MLEPLLAYLQANLITDQNLISDRLLLPYEEYDESGEEFFSVQRAQRVEQVLENRTGVVVLGDAGMGKSVLLRQIRDVFSRQSLRQIKDKEGSKDCLIPYLMSGRDLFLNIETMVAKSPIAKHRKLLQQAGFTLSPFFLIDGVDEIAGRRVTKALANVLSFFGNSRCRFMLASRTVFFQFFSEMFVSAKIDAFRLQPLTSEQTETFCNRNGWDYEQLLQQTRIYGFADMLNNPQMLKFVTEVYRGSIPPENKSDLFGHFIKGQLRKNRLATTDTFYRIVRDAAFVMELLERNVLSVAEFETMVKTRYRRDARNVAAVYDKLNRSGLMVAEGSFIRFEHRSLGEFLAAERMAGQSRNQILDYILFKRKNIIKPSWSSTLSFLIELHDDLRDYCVDGYQRECLEATPAVFNGSQKRKIFWTLFNYFTFDNPAFLYSTNNIKVHRLGYFGSTNDRPRLIAYLSNENVWAKANAALVLGYLRGKKAVPILKSLVLGKENHKIVRLSALESLGVLGSVEDIDELKNGLSSEKDLADHFAITIAILAGEKRIEDVMEVLGHLESMVSMDVIEICRKLKTMTAMEKVLDFLIVHPDYLAGYRHMTYVERLLGNLKQLWNRRISEKLAKLLLTLREKKVWLREEYQNLIVAAIQARDPYRRVIWTILAAPGVRIDRLYDLEKIIGRCLTRNIAKLLVALSPDAYTLVAFAREAERRNNPDANIIHEIFRARISGITAKYEENARVLEKKQIREKKKRMSQEFRLARELRRGKDLTKVLSLAQVVPETDWPQLDDKQKSTLSALVGKHLSSTIARDNITWLSNDTWQAKRRAYESSGLCLRIVKHYGLQLPSSAVLIHHLPYGGEHEQLIINYFQRISVGADDRTSLENLLENETPEAGLRPVIEFAGKLKVGTATMRMKLIRLIRDESHDTQFRIDSLRTYIKLSDPKTVSLLVDIQKSSCKRLVDEATEQLVRLQHVPTIMRLLGNLASGSPPLPTGTHISPSGSGIEWFDLIQTGDRNVWKALVKTIKRAIEERAYSFLYSLLTRLARINRAQTIGLIKRRLPLVNDPTLRTLLTHLEQEFETQELHEVGRVKRVEDALEIIAFTRGLQRVVVFVEGSHDRYLYTVIQTKLSHAGRLPKEVKYFFHPIGGWSNIYAERSNFGEWIEMYRPDPIFVLVDNDVKDKRIIRECEARWNELEIPYHILKRGTPENYYPKELLNKIFRGGAPSKNEIKNQTAKIADALTIKDIKGTDLYDVFAKTLKSLATKTASGVR